MGANITEGLSTMLSKLGLLLQDVLHNNLVSQEKNSDIIIEIMKESAKLINQYNMEVTENIRKEKEFVYLIRNLKNIVERQKKELDERESRDKLQASLEKVSTAINTDPINFEQNGDLSNIKNFNQNEGFHSIGSMQFSYRSFPSIECKECHDWKIKYGESNKNNQFIQSKLDQLQEKHEQLQLHLLRCTYLLKAQEVMMEQDDSFHKYQDHDIEKRKSDEEYSKLTADDDPVIVAGKGSRRGKPRYPLRPKSLNIYEKEKQYNVVEDHELFLNLLGSNIIEDMEETSLMNEDITNNSDESFQLITKFYKK